MKYGSNVMAILLLLGGFSTMQSQEAETNGLQDRQSIRLPVTARIVAHGSSRDFLGVPSRHRLHTNSVTGLGNDRVKSDRLHRGSNSALAKSSPQSRISVIDTAIVRSFTDTTRHVYTFDARAKMTSDLTQILKDDAWLDIGRTTYTYDANGNLLSYLDEYWENGQWVNSRRFTYTYDANGNLLSYLDEYWQNGQLTDSSRTTYAYDANGNLLSYMDEYWENGQWVVHGRSTSSYDANGNMLSDLREWWSNGQWTNGTRYLYTYDEDGNMLAVTEEEWSNGQWVIYHRGAYTYDADGNMTSKTRLWWQQNGQDKRGERATFTYDVSGDKLSELVEGWSDQAADWVISYRNTWAYYSNGHILLRLWERWQNSQWVNVFRFAYTYSAQGDLVSRWRYGWMNDTWTPQDDTEPRPWLLDPVIDDAGNVYWLEYGHNFELTHTLIVTGVASEGGNIASSYSLSQNYPNPFNPSTTIRYGLPQHSHVTLMVFNSLGQQVAMLVQGEQEAGYHEAVFDASNLASGVYLYRLQAGNFVQTRRLILMK